jgi:hypothetical protein
MSRDEGGIARRAAKSHPWPPKHAATAAGRGQLLLVNNSQQNTTQRDKALPRQHPKASNAPCSALRKSSRQGCHARVFCHLAAHFLMLDGTPHHMQSPAYVCVFRSLPKRPMPASPPETAHTANLHCHLDCHPGLYTTQRAQVGQHMLIHQQQQQPVQSWGVQMQHRLQAQQHTRVPHARCSGPPCTYNENRAQTPSHILSPKSSSTHP